MLVVVNVFFLSVTCALIPSSLKLWVSTCVCGLMVGSEGVGCRLWVCVGGGGVLFHNTSTLKTKTYVEKVGLYVFV